MSFIVGFSIAVVVMSVVLFGWSSSNSIVGYCSDTLKNVISIVRRDRFGAERNTNGGVTSNTSVRRPIIRYVIPAGDVANLMEQFHKINEHYVVMENRIAALEEMRERQERRRLFGNQQVLNEIRFNISDLNDLIMPGEHLFNVDD
ncbi:uncharacterized protein LOC112598565 [Melanaphis sacchari]|uniref:uncharacterized protein LOC112598565 n=1 Tax=Melanaphis sacchari TaxID=742174 RepID=UPI000DC13E52|nr:uncharacterized protein LOC112598565 [Melanaphis sacchari]